MATLAFNELIILYITTFISETQTQKPTALLNSIRYKFLWNISISITSFLSYRNLSIDLQSKSMARFLYDRDLRHERVKLIRIFPMYKQVYFLKL